MPPHLLSAAYAATGAVVPQIHSMQAATTKSRRIERQSTSGNRWMAAADEEATKHVVGRGSRRKVAGDGSVRGVAWRGVAAGRGASREPSQRGKEVEEVAAGRGGDSVGAVPQD
ncbi:hypothetical protein DAI22_02g164850 [Oryza sativa Japonica Group]|nr:hypothetical protein DAI22_02g164850 [Oryza sativa Japonica Group]